eukprot:7493186-Lingulodinium_polyedra.AAC.1
MHSCRLEGWHLQQPGLQPLHGARGQLARSQVVSDSLVAAIDSDGQLPQHRVEGRDHVDEDRHHRAALRSAPDG